MHLAQTIIGLYVRVDLKMPGMKFQDMKIQDMDLQDMTNIV